MNKIIIKTLIAAFFTSALFLQACHDNDPIDELLPPETEKPETEKPNPDKEDPKPEPEPEPEPEPNPDPNPEPQPEPGPQPEPEPEPAPKPEIPDKPENWKGQTVWVHGLKQIPDPTQWKPVYGQVKGLAWDAAYGWFDCNKKDPYNEQPNSDSNLCWAATVSNMICWWLKQNSSWVAQQNYQGPSGYRSSKDCAVFDFFKQHFQNTGNNVAAAINWFFTGRSMNGTNAQGGFFKQTFGEGSIVCEVANCDGNRFSHLLKEALSHQKVIGCVHKFGRQTHAINIWGAEFDEQGEVAYIYITDSNDPDYEKLSGRFTAAGMLRREVRIKQGVPYLESSVGGQFTIPIYEITLLDANKR